MSHHHQISKYVFLPLEGWLSGQLLDLYLDAGYEPYGQPIIADRKAKQAFVKYKDEPPHACPGTRIITYIWRFDTMLVIKDTQGDFGGDLKITAVDAKGAVIDMPTGLTVVFTSDKPDVLEVTQSPDNQFALTCKVGVPGQATVIANVSEGENLLFTASETFTVTAGEVASITAGKLEFPSIPA